MPEQDQEVTSIAIRIDSPANGAVLTDPHQGRIAVSGEVSWTATGSYRDAKIGVEVWIGDTPCSVRVGDDVNHLQRKKWSADGRVNRPGPFTINAKASYLGFPDVDPKTDQISVTVVDSVPPTVDIVSPAQNLPIDVLEGDVTSIELKVRTRDDGLGVHKVTCVLDGEPYTAERNIRDTSEWEAVVLVRVPSIALGNRNILVHSEDLAGNRSQPKILAFVGRDITPPHPPHVKIDSPRDGHEHPKGEKLIVRGFAADLQSGIGALEWRLDNESSFEPVPPPWENWSFIIEAERLTPGLHSVEIRCQDKAGHWSDRHPDLILNFEVSDVYVPQDASDLVSVPAYLLDLLRFSRRRINMNYPSVDAQLKDADLDRLFYQPFGRLGDVRTMRASEPVNQLRPCIEVLRRFLIGTLSTATHLLAHWRFDEGKGDTLADATGNGHTGTRNGASWTAGRVGSTLLFDGTTNHVVVRGSDALRDLTGNFSIAFWVYPKATHEIDAESDQGGTGTGGQRYVIYPVYSGGVDSPDHAGVGISVGTNGVSVYEHTENYLPPLLVQAQDLQNWTHVAVVYRENAPHLYLNGKIVRHGLRSKKPHVHAYFEAIGGGSYGYYSGYLDDIRVFVGSLTEVEVAALANARISSEELLPDPVLEVDYRWAVYQALLNRIGTSYEELRLARKADPRDKEAITDRLGLPSSTPQDPLEALLLSREVLAETDLERLFGHVDTTRDPLADPPLREPQWLTWRRMRLETLWRAEDAETFDRSDAPLPIIDPDLISEGDLTLAKPGNLAFDLWTRRKQALEAKYKELEDKYKDEGHPPAKEIFAQILSIALGDQAPKVQELEEKEHKGNDIAAELAALGFTESAFHRLLRIRDLAQAETDTEKMLGSEWEDACHILVQAWKENQFTTWRNEETTAGREIVITPSFFTMGAPVPRVPWRSFIEARLAWEERLQRRFDQARALIESLLSDIAAVEEQTLPLLRDALVGSLARRLGLHPDDCADYLTRRLFVDARSRGALRTTRLRQAIETLQSLVEALRLRHLIESHPAVGWKLASIAKDDKGELIVREVDPRDFATEWKYMGAYDAWCGAMSVFFFPENLLLPSLRSDASPAFSSAIEILRGKRRITKKDVDDAVYTRGLHEDERKYYMPMEVALRLQATGDYLRALDWFRTVYPYHTPLAERKIGEGLFDHERNDAPLLQRPGDWILKQDPKEELNPHRVARLRNGTNSTNAKTPRSNPYTRYTLMAVARCFNDYADSEFASETLESLARARNLYLSARDLLALPELDPPTPLSPAELDPKSVVVYPNPVLEGLRRRVEVQLTKLREGRNIAGLRRQVEMPMARSAETSVATVGIGGQLIISSVRSFLRPTPYRYQVLIERSKQLVNIAQPVEANFLAALEKHDKETYDLLQAKFGLQLANESVELQRRRHDGVTKEVELTDLQRKRVTILQDTYDKRLNAGLNRYERQVLSGYGKLSTLKFDLDLLQANAGICDAFLGYVQGGVTGGPIGAAFGGIKAALSVGRILEESALKLDLNRAELAISVGEKMASFERQKDEWHLQKSVADQDALIADKQIDIAKQHERVSLQELRISGVQAAQAEATAVFLATKFSNAELYEWMGRVLREVYSYFLQQAAAIAQLAQNQLAFERQEVPPAFIQADYWETPPEGATDPTTQSQDRQGLTGSARLLQDIYKLEQYAFETDKRKLNLSQTFSLASLFPYEFTMFRESGALLFATPMELFDGSFPGHYLRLIKRVKVSIIALIPPNRGVRATLRASGISRVVGGGGSFQGITISRNPELIALTSPMNTSGVFELDLQSDMLLPFEGMGVDTNWVLDMPKAANPFDFGTIADVLFAVDYTALHSDEYRREVIQRLPRRVSADLSFSIRNQFPDAWYDLNNPELLEEQKQTVINFATKRGDFPPHIDDSSINIQQLVLYFVLKDGKARKEIPITSLTFKGKEREAVGGGAITIDGIVSTRRGNSDNWRPIVGKTPFGEWELKLPNTDEMKKRFNDEIEDILFVMTYSGRMPAWPT